MAFRRPRSFRDILVRAELHQSPSQSHDGLCQSCGDKRCHTCRQIRQTSTFNSHTTGSTFKIRCNVNCKSKNVIYVLQCKCGLQYVGETDQPFHKRMNGHRSDYEKKPDLPLSRHLRSSNHSKESLNELSITIIDQNLSWSKEDRQNREKFWMRKLKSLSPYGINEKGK